jgi:hypothetical protein
MRTGKPSSRRIRARNSADVLGGLHRQGFRGGSRTAAPTGAKISGHDCQTLFPTRVWQADAGASALLFVGGRAGCSATSVSVEGC